LGLGLGVGVSVGAGVRGSSLERGAARPSDLRLEPREPLHGALPLR
jgi:hypothetical protein